MHTEFVRERAQPGMLCVGADSHSCSAGAVSCLSIGMGATDVAMPLITGQTWFAVPESVNLYLINSPPKGIGGKDTILYILQQFKRNTIAADRVVEFSGPGLKHLSCDARFAIANMCTVGLN
jgi:homoaconitase/3-isopropylmalate dehydratase large subunit